MLFASEDMNNRSRRHGRCAALSSQQAQLVELFGPADVQTHVTVPDVARRAVDARAAGQASLTIRFLEALRHAGFMAGNLRCRCVVAFLHRTSSAIPLSRKFSLSLLLSLTRALNFRISTLIELSQPYSRLSYKRRGLPRRENQLQCTSPTAHSTSPEDVGFCRR